MASQMAADEQGLEEKEIPVMTVWPSICLYKSGEVLGKWLAIRWPDIYIFRLGNLIALLSIPWALLLYFRRVVPIEAVRYTLTDQRVTIQRGMLPTVTDSIGWSEFDEIEVEQHEGQIWYDAADLVFRRQATEVFRLPSVSRPEPFRQVCCKTQSAVLAVHEVRQQQLTTS
jgi:hypothetical protein